MKWKYNIRPSPNNGALERTTRRTPHSDAEFFVYLHRISAVTPKGRHGQLTHSDAVQSLLLRSSAPLLGLGLDRDNHPGFMSVSA